MHGKFPSEIKLHHFTFYKKMPFFYLLINPLNLYVHKLEYIAHVVFTVPEGFSWIWKWQISYWHKVHWI